MTSQRYLVSLIFLAHSLCLCSETLLQYKTGVSYPDGFTAGLGLEERDFDTSITFRYSQNDLDLSQFAFRSEYISLGSVMFSGISSGLRGYGLRFFDSSETNRSIIDPDGNPETNLGVIFSAPKAPVQLSVFRRIDYTGGLLCFEPAILSRGSLFLGQTFRTVEEKEIDASWYLDEPMLFSNVQFHSLASLILGVESLYGGGTIILNWSREDRGGFSLLLLGGISLPFMECQSELLWASPSYVDFELDTADFPFIWKTHVSFPDFPFLLESYFHLRFGKDSLPWDDQEFSFKNQNRIDYSSGRHRIEGEFDWALVRTEKGEWDPQLTLNLKYRRVVFPFYWESGAKGGLSDNLFRYILSLSAGVDSKPFDAEASLSLEIDEKILLNSGFSILYATEKYALTGKVELKDIGIYNSEEVEFKPSISLELKVKQLISF